MKLIKIDRSTIRRNKDAGSTVSYVPTKWTCSFDYKGKVVPIVDEVQNDWFAIDTDLLNHNEDYLLTEVIHGDQDLVVEARGCFTKPFDYEVVRKVEGISNISEQYERVKVEHPPIPKYSFKYEDVEVTCQFCRKSTLMREVEVYVDGAGESHEMCPLCLSLDSFEQVEFEDIESVVGQDV